MGGSTVERPGWRARARPCDRAGFTLIETLISSVLLLLIISGVVGLMSSQRTLYDVQSDLAYLQKNVRAAVDLMAADIRTIPAGGLTAAEVDSLTIRYRIRQGAICGVVPTDLSDAYMYLQVPAQLFAGHVQSGFAILEPGDSVWDYYEETDSLPVVPLLLADSVCTTYAPPAPPAKGKKKDEDPPPPGPPPSVVADPGYVRFDNLAIYHGSVPPVKSLFIVYTDVTYKLAPSEFEPGTRALFRNMPGVTQELAGLFSNGAGFEYVLRDGSVLTSVGGGQLADIVEVRIKAWGYKTRQVNGKAQTRRFEATVKVPLRNVRGGA